MKLFKAKKRQYSNICFLNNDYFEKENLDLYEILGRTDYLMTDFSSIYFDYLHLNKPIFFISNYLNQYERIRGLLLAPYQKVVPGATIHDQAEMVAALSNLDNDNFAKKRHYWLDLTYTIPSQKNCQRNFDNLHN